MTQVSMAPTSGPEPADLATLARLRYVSDQEVGFSRTRKGAGFVYAKPRGAPLSDSATIKRIERLAIPPAWREVWICRFAKGHLQATGRDSRKRKQYVYHHRWNEISNLAKFYRLSEFGNSLPKLRREISRLLRGNQLTRERVLAGIVGVLDATSVRIGNEEYVDQNGSYGLTTLRDRHAIVARGSVELRFVGKGGFRIQATIVDKPLIKLVKQSRRVRGARLFQYLDDHKVHAAAAGDVNDFLRERTGESFTAKDFRTWKASALVAGRLFELRDVDGVTKRRRLIKAVVEDAAASLGNTPAICRNYYIHPGLLASYEDGSFDGYFKRFALRRLRQFSKQEQILACFLTRWESSQLGVQGTIAKS